MSFWKLTLGLPFSVSISLFVCMYVPFIWKQSKLVGRRYNKKKLFTEKKHTFFHKKPSMITTV